MGLVLEGRVDILSTDYWGSETLMARLGPGELFGEVFAGQGWNCPMTWWQRRTAVSCGCVPTV